MSSSRLPAPVRQSVARDSNFRCGYCLTSQAIIGPLLEVDHIVPRSRGGVSNKKNLILACPNCNGHKSNRRDGIDPESGTVVRLFNPRVDSWEEHFEWIQEGIVIHGKTPIGRETVVALDMNHPDIINACRLWVEVGWHPPRS